MTNTKSSDTSIETCPAIPQEAFDWYDEYAHGDIDRRTFLSRLGTLSVAGLSMGTIAGALIPNYALAEQVSFNDGDIKATYQTFSSSKGHGEGSGYLVLPKNIDDQAPVVLVIHENRGLNPYIKDVARRLAKKGFIAFAPDILHSVGGYPGNDDEGKALQKSLDSSKMEEDFKAAALFLKNHPLSNNKLGVVGFCYGGYISNMLAADIPDIVNAAVPFYGTPPRANINQIKAPLMLQFGELDKRVNATWSGYESALKEQSVVYQAFIYKGVNHGFHNDSTARYNEKNAELAWIRTIEFFKTHLSS